MLRKAGRFAGSALRRAAPVFVGLLVVVGAAYAIKTQLLDDEAAPAARVSVQVLPAGTFDAAHPYAPYYVVPRKRFGSPSDLTHTARNNLVTKPESALAKGALAGSPQIVRLVLHSESEGPVTLAGVRAKVVSHARPLHGWFTALPSCQFEPVQRARLNLDARRAATRYVGADRHSSKTLALKLDRTRAQIIELQASTRRHRVAWVAQLTVRNKDGDPSTITVDDGGKPFRVTSERESRSYRPIYGVAGIIGYAPQKRGFDAC